MSLMVSPTVHAKAEFVAAREVDPVEGFELRERLLHAEELEQCSP